MTPDVRPAAADDHVDVMGVLDAGLLASSADTVERRIDAGNVLVAVEDDRVLGAVVCVPRPDGAHVEAVSVRPKRRGGGLGTALIQAAADRWGRLTAEFDPHLRSFYEDLGFECEPTRGDRFQAERRPE